MNTYLRQLDHLIEALLSSKISFAEFGREYSDWFINHIPDSAFTPSDLEHYGTIHERAEWTSEAPTHEERGYGWMDVTDFVSWVSQYHQK